MWPYTWWSHTLDDHLNLVCSIYHLLTDLVLSTSTYPWDVCRYILYFCKIGTEQWQSQGLATLGLSPGSPASSTLGPSEVQCCLRRGTEHAAAMDTETDRYSARAAPKPVWRHHSSQIKWCIDLNPDCINAPAPTPKFSILQTKLTELFFPRDPVRRRQYNLWPQVLNPTTQAPPAPRPRRHTRLLTFWVALAAKIANSRGEET